MAFAKKGKANKDENKIEVIKPLEDKKIIASKEEKILCPHCKQVIGTKLGEIYQVLDQRLVSLKRQICPKCNKDIK